MSSQESKLSLDSFLLSETDEKGIIRFANDEFCKFAEYRARRKRFSSVVGDGVGIRPRMVKLNADLGSALVHTVRKYSITRDKIIGFKAHDAG